MFAILILPILACGIIIFETYPHLTMRARKYGDQEFYLHTVKYGVTVSIYTLFFFFALSYFWPSLSSMPDRIATDLDKLFGTNPPRHSRHVDIAVSGVFCITAFFISAIWAILNTLAFRKTGVIKGKSVRGLRLLSIYRQLASIDPYEQLLFDAWCCEEPVMVTQSSGKIYVGIVAELGSPMEDDGKSRSIGLVTLLSGYRSADMKPVLTTSYNNCGKPPPRLLTVIPKESVCTISWFDLDFYEATQGAAKLVLPWRPKDC